MSELLTAKQMFEIENIAISSGRVSELDLMEQAGQLAANVIEESFCSSKSTSFIILCGPGNNGGDGYAIASRLHSKGCKVNVWELTSSHKQSSAANLMRERWANFGACKPINLLSKDDFIDEVVIVDALFGIGLRSEVIGAAARAIKLSMQYAPIVAIDILSGVQANTGKFAVSGILKPKPADLTIAFECAKLGHFIGKGGNLTGRLNIVSLGLNKELQQLGDAESFTRRWTLSEFSVDKLNKCTNQHKYSHGHTLVVSGKSLQGGAARLAAQGALRVGSGLVTIASPRDALAEHAAQLNAIMLKEINNSQQLLRLLDDKRIKAVCIGPGLGLDSQAKSLVLSVLNSGQKIVLDADALTAFRLDPHVMFNNLCPQVVLTPHFGEFRKLFPAEADNFIKDENGGPIQSVRSAAKRANAVIVLKGAVTFIANPLGKVWLSTAIGRNSVPWLATAGSGDVLAGIITGLMARGFDADLAAGLGTYIHTQTAKLFGPGLIAEDIPELIPHVINNILCKNISKKA